LPAAWVSDDCGRSSLPPLRTLSTSLSGRHLGLAAGRSRPAQSFHRWLVTSGKKVLLLVSLARPEIADRQDYPAGGPCHKVWFWVRWRRLCVSWQPLRAQRRDGVRGAPSTAFCCERLSGTLLPRQGSAWPRWIQGPSTCLCKGGRLLDSARLSVTRWPRSCLHAHQPPRPHINAANWKAGRRSRAIRRRAAPSVVISIGPVGRSLSGGFWHVPGRGTILAQNTHISITHFGDPLGLPAERHVSHGLIPSAS
jgi:hypothetical protein